MKRYALAISIAILAIAPLSAFAQQYSARRSGEIVLLEDAKNQNSVIRSSVGRQCRNFDEGQRSGHPALALCVY